MEEGFLICYVRLKPFETPIINAVVKITDMENLSREQSFITDFSGRVGEVKLLVPNRAYSQLPEEKVLPYGKFTIEVTHPQYETVLLEGVEVFAGQISEIVVLMKEKEDEDEEIIFIPDHLLFSDSDKKIEEAIVKPVILPGQIVLDRVVIPETIIVHDGVPSDKNAKNYYVPYRDYIKNVVSSEIYPTWPKETIIANILAINSITLNRVYTEWYRNKGYDFTITSSTAYDQKWIYGRNIYENIDQLVDEIFSNYLSLPNVKQPAFTQYCDGKKVTCPNWMSQWGSKFLGDQGLSAIQILRRYYGDDIYINVAEIVQGIPVSYPGYPLSIGERGEKVRQLQEQLSVISKVYSLIPSLTPDGIFGEQTANSVSAFQEIFGLPVTGIVDKRTWYKISQIYVGVTKIGSL